MDLALVERLMQLLEKSTVTTLEVTEGNLRIRLSKLADSSAGRLESSPQPAVRAIEPRQPQPPSGLVRVTAGMSGTFYRAPSPGAEPFVKVGDMVGDGDRLALIETMKMLTPVEAETEGTVRLIHVADGTPVEPGTPLFDLEKTMS